MKHIKITSVLGVISYVAFNDDLYKRLNKQNDKVAPERKSKIETVDITEAEIQAQTGFNEAAALAINPVASKLIQENESKDREIAELKAKLGIQDSGKPDGPDVKTGDEKSKKK